MDSLLERAGALSIAIGSKRLLEREREFSPAEPETFY